MPACEAAQRTPFALVEFDTWRARYTAMSAEEQVAFHSRIWQAYPVQQHYDLDCVDEFFAAVTDIDLKVLEIGGWTGDVADYVLEKDERISEWLNVELCIEAAQRSVALRHPVYGACVMQDFVWNQQPEFFERYNVAFMSHSIEHLDRRDLMALAPVLKGWLYIDAPLPETGRPYWWGCPATHQLDMNWDELREFWEARGWTLVGERRNEQEDSMARWFRRDG